MRDLLTQTADALAVAHRAGIVHRDVKPANLLVTPDRRVKVTDFGIARAADDAQITRTGAVMGTPQYLSPEQARGNPSTPASDVYSLGVVAFECLTGRRPFEADSPVATALAHIQQPVPDLPDDLPEDLRTDRRAARWPRTLPSGTPTAPRSPPRSAAPRSRRPPVAPAVPDPGRTPPPSCRPRAEQPPVAGRAARARRADAAAGPPGGLPRCPRRPERKSRVRGSPPSCCVLLLVAAAIAVVVLLVGQDDDEPTSSNDHADPLGRRRSSSDDRDVVERSDDADDHRGRDGRRRPGRLRRPRPVRGRGRAAAARLGRPASSRTTNPGDEDEDTVASLNPTGELPVDDPIDVHYWGAAAGHDADHRDDDAHGHRGHGD